MARFFKTLTFSLAGALGVAISTPGLADALYVRGDIGYLADQHLFILDLTKAPPTTLETVLIGDATDVTVENCRAVVTTGAAGGKGVVVVDLSDLASLGEGYCSDYDGDDDSGGGSAGDQVLYDSHKGTLSLFCVEVEGLYYNVIMEQRGSYSNWELTFAEPTDDCE